jgi:hypothetical protein
MAFPFKPIGNIRLIYDLIEILAGADRYRPSIQTSYIHANAELAGKLAQVYDFSIVGLVPLPARKQYS